MFFLAFLSIDPNDKDLPICMVVRIVPDCQERLLTTVGNANFVHNRTKIKPDQIISYLLCLTKSFDANNGELFCLRFLMNSIMKEDFDLVCLSFSVSVLSDENIRLRNFT